MTGYLNLRKFEFSSEIIIETYSFLRRAGVEGFEAVALFAGKIENQNAHITEVIFPEQKSYKLESGLMYAVDGEELHRINVWLYKKKLKLLGQIHSHPQDAYHSDADDAFPIMSTQGGLSIVVPDFAKHPLNPLEWAYYRLSKSGDWLELTESEIIDLIHIK